MKEWYGFYHPKATTIFTTLADYEQWYAQNIRPIKDLFRVGLYFSRDMVEKNNLRVIKAIIREIEKRERLIPIPLFAQNKEYAGPDCPEAEDILKLFSGCDLIINLTSSFLIKTSK